MPHLPSADIQCPYCGETITVFIDATDDDQQYVEDCHVCCRPINLRATVDEDGDAHVQAWGQDEA